MVPKMDGIIIILTKPGKSEGKLSLSYLTPAAGSGCLHARSGRRSRALGYWCLLNCLGARSGGLLLGSRGVPVPEHLDSEDHVKGEATNESVKDKLVVDFLEGRKDSRQGSDEVVEHLIRKRN